MGMCATVLLFYILFFGIGILGLEIVSHVPVGESICEWGYAGIIIIIATLGGFLIIGIRHKIRKRQKWVHV